METLQKVQRNAFLNRFLEKSHKIDGNDLAFLEIKD